jgi:hypothetical protein
VETITVAASRGSAFSLSETQVLVGGALVVALLVWMLFARLRRDRAPPV